MSFCATPATAAFGILGGRSGCANTIEFRYPDGSVLRPRLKDLVSAIPAGTVYRQVAGGGGGYGDPRERPAARVLEEARNGVISLECARSDYGVAFLGPALFRAAVKLPANIPVGPLDARVYLFHDGQLLAAQKASVTLEREGVDRLVYDFAFDHPVLYGLLTVTIATLAGFLASVVFRR